MDMKTKSIALENIDKLREMDVSTGHTKMDHWTGYENTLSIINLSIGPQNSILKNVSLFKMHTKH